MEKNTTQQLNFDRQMMRKCLKLASLGRGFVAPNPLVGATLVKNGRIISVGYHQKFGEAHAEINALKNATEPVEDATLYVNLEPCSHQGKTPACSVAIIHHRIKRVVISTLDPNPLVSGKGVEQLKAAGIEVNIGILKKESQKLNEHFFRFIQSQKPFIALKMATSLDGKIATFSGDSKWITNEKSRAYAHKLRQEYSAILVGINTVLSDNPELNVRTINGEISNPLRIVLDSHLRIPLEAKILNPNIAPTWIASTRRADPIKIGILEQKGIRILICPEKNGQVDLKYLVKKLGEEGIDSLLVEGGGSVNFSFVQEQLVDKVYTFLAPKLIGGQNALSGLEGSGFNKLKEALQLKNLTFKKMSTDLLIEAYT